MLALDGGGLRGAFSARILLELERRLARPLHTLFDYIIGTSTGGLIALAVAVQGYTGQQCLELYREVG